MEIQTETINSLTKYVDQISYYSDWMFYRGHANGKDWELKPSLARLVERNNINVGHFGDWKGLEDTILERFRRNVYPHLKNVPDEKIDWLVLGQNYGLPTRLLDWTENALVALFFALNENFETESAVWGIRPLISYTMEINLDSLEGIQIYFPKTIDPRIVAQKGCFTVEPLPHEINPYLSIEEQIEESDFGLHEIVKFIIPNDNNIKDQLMRDLMNLGVDNSVIYPDISGLCKQIDYELKKGISRF